MIEIKHQYIVGDKFGKFTKNSFIISASEAEKIFSDNLKIMHRYFHVGQGISRSRLEIMIELLKKQGIDPYTVLLGHETIFNKASNNVLMVVLCILALLYGLRLIFIHFKPHELEYKDEKPIYQKICGLFGPVVSGFLQDLLERHSSLSRFRLP